MIKKIIGIGLLAAAGIYVAAKKIGGSSDTNKKDEGDTTTNLRNQYLIELAKNGAVINYFETLVDKDGIARGTKFSGVIIGNVTYYIADGMFVRYTIDELKNTGSGKVTNQNPNSSNPNTTNNTDTVSTLPPNGGAGAGSSFGVSGFNTFLN